MLGDSTWLIVGKLVAPQGLIGELRVNPSTDFPERFTEPGQRWLKKKTEQPRQIDLIAGRKLPGKSIYVVRFAGINDRNSAESLVGQSLLVPADWRPKLAKGEFHLLDLVGLKVMLGPEGLTIGYVIDLIHAGNDLLVVELEEGRKVLIPFVEPIVPEINIHEGWLRLTPPPGLLEL